MILSAQEPGGRGRGRGPAAPPKNLKVLPADANLIPTMRAAAAGLGVMCTFCHVQDRSSDEKPEKLTARMMFQMVNDINSKFPDGKVHVTCYTCHRGAEMPLMAAPAAQ
ncbi:MAG TPA: c-type cytochrome [Bryobacteraceae bacterium]|nr:c-type cytochrome [Bryobacteraceae bacterium]